MNNLEQEQEWKMRRLGKITASQFAHFVKTDKNGGYILSNSDTAKNLIYRIAWERIASQNNITNALERLNIDSRATEHGNIYEGAAVLRYESVSGNKVEYVNRYNAYNDDVGGTPDGYVGDDGLIEIKVPFNGGNHLRTLLTGEIYNKDYMYQIQGYLMITGRQWCDFITYDPDMPEGLDISINRIERNEVIINGIDMVIKRVVEELEVIKSKIK